MRFNHNNTKAQKYFMGGFEKTVELHKSALLPKVVTILKTLYDEDIVEEEVCHTNKIFGLVPVIMSPFMLYSFSFF